MVSACLQSAIVRPTVKSQTPKSARSIRAPIRCSAHKNGTGHVEASKLAALAAAASLLLAQPSFAGPLSDMLPKSSPAPPKEKFERDLGEGRKLQADSSTKNNASRVSSGKQGGPSDSADARDSPDMKVTGGGLPGISKSLPKSSTSAPIS